MTDAPRRRRAERVFDKLLRGLAVGQWPGGAPLPPTRQLERRFGSSHATVLEALHLAAERGLLRIKPRRPVEVAPGAAAKAGRLLAEQAARNGVRRLAILYPETLGPIRQQPFFRQLVDAVEAQARKVGVAADLLTWSLLEQANIARQLPDMGYGAAFIAGVRVEYLTSLHALRQLRFPVVLMNASMPELPLPAVSMDEYGAARRIASHLADLGHRNLCLVALAFDGRLKQRQSRTYGWLDYLTETGLDQTSSVPIHYLTEEEVVVRDVLRILAVPNPPTALVFGYGALCKRFMEEYDGGTLRVPQQLSIATFDPVSRVKPVPWCPVVTGLTINMDRIAECVLEMIEKMFAGTERPRNIRIPMQLNLTESIGPPPRS